MSKGQFTVRDGKVWWSFPMDQGIYEHIRDVLEEQYAKNPNKIAELQFCFREAQDDLRFAVKKYEELNGITRLRAFSGDDA